MVGAGAAAGLVPARAAARQEELDPWRFELDGAHRWSLRRGRSTVINGAEIRVDLAGGLSASLDDLRGTRRLRSGTREAAIWTVVGRFEQLEINAQFNDGREPWITVRVRGLGDARGLDEVHYTGGVTVPQATAWINGFQSWSPCQVVALPASGAVTGHWQLALPGRDGLGLLFGEEDDGAGEFRLRGRRLDSTAVFGGRLVSAAHAPAVSTLAIYPAEDPLAALAGACAVRAGTPQGSLAPGWRSWHALPRGVTEAAVLDAVSFAHDTLDPRAFRVIQIDDGYQLAAGIWEMNPAFPNGHAWLTERIRLAGFEAALWLAPFAVTPVSGIPAQHPEWLIPAPDGQPLQLGAQAAWGGPVYALDASQRDVQDWLRQLARKATLDWGYSRLVLDHLYLGAAGGRRIGGLSAWEALRSGIRALREGARRAAVVAGGAPLQFSLGLADAARSGDHVRANWEGVKIAAAGLLRRARLAGRAWVNDPDGLVVGGGLSLDEARAWASLVTLSGSLTMASDVLRELPAERLEIVQRALPPVAPRAQVLDLGPSRPGDDPPSWLLTRVGDDWWMVAAVNWTDRARRLTMNLALHGVRGPLLAYDAWAGERAPDVRGPLSLQVPAHSVKVLGLRRPRSYPCVIGSTRHIAQGAIDVVDELWDAGARRLTGKAVMLDGRPYRLTIAVPRGFSAQGCSGGTECTMTDPPGALRLDFGATRADVEWEVQF